MPESINISFCYFYSEKGRRGNHLNYMSILYHLFIIGAIWFFLNFFIKELKNARIKSGVLVPWCSCRLIWGTCIALPNKLSSSFSKQIVPFIYARKVPGSQVYSLANHHKMNTSIKPQPRSRNRTLPAPWSSTPHGPSQSLVPLYFPDPTIILVWTS